MFAKKPLMEAFKTAGKLAAVAVIPMTMSASKQEHADITMMNNFLVSGFIATLGVRRYKLTEHEMKRQNPFKPE